MGLCELANPFQGTDSRFDFSSGNTYPAIGVPRGLTYWSPQTSDAPGFFFDWRSPKFAGFRATHCPSPWMGDYGHLEVMPVCGAVGITTASRASAYQVQAAHATPAAFHTHLQRYGIDARLAASYSCAILQFVFPADAADSAAIVLQTGQAATTLGSIELQAASAPVRILGRSMSHSGGVADNFACHFVAELEGAELIGTQLLHAGGLVVGQSSLVAPRAGIILRLRPRGPVTLRIGTSFVSADQARLNLSREIAGRNLEQVAAATTEEWERWLSRVQVSGGSERDRRTLYTCLYRVGLWPTPMHERDEQGRWHHYSPHTGRIEPGRLFTNSGFWDTHRTLFPLLRLIAPEVLGEVIDGFLSHWRESGWLPKWCSPGHRDCMIGSHSDAVVAEAVLGGISGFDSAEAYQAIRKNAFEPVDGHGRFGRRALREYLQYGFVPAECADASLSWTLDNAHCDWCVGQVALRLGHHADAQALLKRSQNYRQVWDAKQRFFRARRRDGSWVEPFEELCWGHGYVEGGPWQFAFHVPHDPNGLAELLGGPEPLIQRLDQMLSTPPRFEVGSYHFEIHEMTEMALARDEQELSFGQYAHSNQPVHSFLWLPAALGRPDWSARQARRVMRSLYSPTHLPGDEDNGEMAAWYVLAALGQAVVCPGSGTSLSVPTGIFEHAQIQH